MLVAVYLDKAESALSNKNGLYYLFDPQATTAIKKPDVTQDENWHKLGGFEDFQSLANAYTDEEIDGLALNIDNDNKIVITNKAGKEIASVDATKFIKDGMIENVVYDNEAKQFIITWNVDAGKETTETVLSVSDLVDTYTAGTGIKIENNQISIDDNVIATVDSLKALSDIIDTKQNANQVADIVNNALNTRLIDYATIVALNNKVDNSIYAAHLDNYAKDKSTFAIADTVNSKFETLEDSIQNIVNDLDKNYYTKDEINDITTSLNSNISAVTATANSNTALISNLSGRVDEIVSLAGGEPNVINTIKVNGIAQAIDSQKAVDITVPVIADTSILELKDGTALINQVTQSASEVAALKDSVSTLKKIKPSEEISMSDDGTLGVNKVSIDKLVQAEEELLILDGGESSGTNLNSNG
jgi:hypothetical protein